MESVITINLQQFKTKSCLHAKLVSGCNSYIKVYASAQSPNP